VREENGKGQNPNPKSSPNDLISNEKTGRREWQKMTKI